MVDMAAVAEEDTAAVIGATEAAATTGVDTTTEGITAAHITMTDTTEAPITITGPLTESASVLADMAAVCAGTAGITGADKRSFKFFIRASHLSRQSRRGSGRSERWRFIPETDNAQ